MRNENIQLLKLLNTIVDSLKNMNPKHGNVDAHCAPKNSARRSIRHSCYFNNYEYHHNNHQNFACANNKCNITGASNKNNVSRVLEANHEISEIEKQRNSSLPSHKCSEIFYL